MAIYHLSVKYGSRAKSKSAAAKYKYIVRDGHYGDQERHDACLLSGSGNMPKWAQNSPESYWKAADKHERANGRLYQEIEFALPKELSMSQQKALTKDFLHFIVGDDKLPFTLAMHAGSGTNPHVHLVYSERMNDGIERSPELWFKRANKKDPTLGGALKTRTHKVTGWTEAIREKWASLANEHLARAGQNASIDHRSYKRQGANKLPQLKEGLAVQSENYRDRVAYNKSLPIKNKRLRQEANLKRLKAQVLSLSGRSEKGDLVALDGYHEERLSNRGNAYPSLSVAERNEFSEKRKSISKAIKDLAIRELEGREEAEITAPNDAIDKSNFFDFDDFEEDQGDDFSI